MSGISRSSMFVFMLSAFLLGGCADTAASPEVSIDGPGSFEGVLVSEASSLVEQTGYEEVLVRGEDKADFLIEQLNGKELAKADKEELQQRSAELKEAGNYRMLLYNAPQANSPKEIYPITLFEDGAIQLEQEGISYFVANPPEGLLAQLKEDWNITF